MVVSCSRSMVGNTTQDSSQHCSVPAKHCMFLLYSFAFFASLREVFMKKEALYAIRW